MSDCIQFNSINGYSTEKKVGSFVSIDGHITENPLVVALNEADNPNFIKRIVGNFMTRITPELQIHHASRTKSISIPNLDREMRTVWGSYPRSRIEEYMKQIHPYIKKVYAYMSDDRMGIDFDYSDIETKQEESTTNISIPFKTNLPLDDPNYCVGRNVFDFVSLENVGDSQLMIQLRHRRFTIDESTGYESRSLDFVRKFRVAHIKNGHVQPWIDETPTE